MEQKPISVYFRKDGQEYFNNLPTKSYNQLVNNADTLWDLVLCTTWDELSVALNRKPHQVIFHVDTVDMHGVTLHEFISMIETLIKVTGNTNIPLALGVEITTPLSLIKIYQKHNIHGIVPSAKTFGSDETYKGIEALFNRIPYWPKHILDQLPGVKKKLTKNTITLTARQTQVVDLISERGLSNKKIAQALNITESTVKIHVSAILKAYGVRTRTQLAVVTNR
jgi:DNA-binding NarL/FixJ family response regulator